MKNIQLGNKSYFYDIILVCKDGPYTHYWDELKGDWDEKNSKCLIDFINDKTSRLDWFDYFSAKVEALDNKSKEQQPELKKMFYLILMGLQRKKREKKTGVKHFFRKFLILAASNSALVSV